MIPGMMSNRLSLAVLISGALILFAAGGTIGGNLAATGEPLPADNDAIPEFSETYEPHVRETLAGVPSPIVTAFIEVSKPLLAVPVWGMAAGFESYHALGQAATKAWITGSLVVSVVVAMVGAGSFRKQVREATA